MIVEGALTPAQVTAAARRRHRAEVAGWVVIPAWVAVVVSGQRWWVGAVVLAAGALLTVLWPPVTRRWGGPSRRERHAEQWRSREFTARQELALRRCADPGEEWRWAVTAAARRRVRSAPVVGLAAAVAVPAGGWLLVVSHEVTAWSPGAQLAGAVAFLAAWAWTVLHAVRRVLAARRWLAATRTAAVAVRTPDAPDPASEPSRAPS